MAGPAASLDAFAAVREALRQDAPAVFHVEHLDITCDGCEREPIVGHRFKCTVCEDIDLCGDCMRALVAARVKMSQEAAPRAAPPRQGGRPRRWVAKLRSADVGEKWAALQTAVPCLHPSHKFEKVREGPERAVVFVADQPPSSSGSCDKGQQQQQQQQQQQAVDAAATALASAALHDGVAGTGPQTGPNSRLEQFLATFRPSQASCRDVAWIVVEAGQQQQQQQQAAGLGASSSSGSTAGGKGSLEERVDAAVEEWEQLVASGRRPNAADVDRLAAKHRILRGKWMLFARSAAEADAAWAAVARAVCGGPHPLCASAKVSSTGPPPDASWVLCVYVESYQDAADVQRVCAGLQAALPRGLLQDRRLLFKPDVYTFLGIYARNEWGLKPSTLEARLA